MNVGVMGSREFRHGGLVETPVYQLSVDDTVVTGDTEGVDETAREAARRSSCSLTVIERNDKPQGAHHQEKLDACDRVVIFWNGESEGTRDLIERALAMDMEAKIHVMP